MGSLIYDSSTAELTYSGPTTADIEEIAQDEIAAAALNDLSNVAGDTPNTNHVLKWSGTEWAPGYVVYGSLTGTPAIPADTDDISEGSSLYFTDERVDDRVSDLLVAGSNITLTYDDVSGTLTISSNDTEDDLSNNTTDDLSEGTTNKYFSNTLARSAFDTGAGITISNGTISIEDGDVSHDMLATDSVQMENIKINSVTTDKIADSNVTTAKIANDAVTAAKIHSDTAGSGLVQDTDGSLKVNVAGALAIVSDAVSLKEPGVNSEHISDDAVTSAKIDDAAVTTIKIADDAVTALKINSDVAGNGLTQEFPNGALAIDETSTVTFSIVNASTRFRSPVYTLVDSNDSALGYFGASAVDTAEIGIYSDQKNIAVYAGTGKSVDISAAEGINLTSDVDISENIVIDKTFRVQEKGLLVSSGGAVGINILNPEARLDIDGDLKVRQSMTVTGSFAISDADVSTGRLAYFNSDKELVSSNAPQISGTEINFNAYDHKNVGSVIIGSASTTYTTPFFLKHIASGDHHAAVIESSATDGFDGGLLVRSYQPRITLEDRSTSQYWTDIRQDSGDLKIGRGSNSDLFSGRSEILKINNSGLFLDSTGLYFTSATTGWNAKQASGALGNKYLNFYYGSTIKAFLGNFGSSNTALNFTGQHKTKGEEETYLSSSVGLIVSSTGDYISSEQQKININEALPFVKLSDKKEDKAAFGVISDAEDPNESTREYKMGNFVSVSEKAEDDNRIVINSLGEGGIWITNINGDLENGDFITTSDISGYGMKQNDDLLHNYTVAKITCDCSFDLDSEIYNCEEFEFEGQIYRKAFVGCTYHCG